MKSKIFIKKENKKVVKTSINKPDKIKIDTTKHNNIYKNSNLKIKVEPIDIYISKPKTTIKTKFISTFYNKSYKNNYSFSKRKASILYEKFIEFNQRYENKRKIPPKSNSIKSPKKKPAKTHIPISEKYNNSNKTQKNESVEIKYKFKLNLNDSIFNSTKKTKKFINESDIFNKYINVKEDNKSINNNTCNFVKRKKDENEKNTKQLKRINSCRNFNIDKLSDKLVKKIHNMKKNNTNPSLISQKYYERIKNNRYKYYNGKNIDYINERRQRVEDKNNENIFENYKIIRPLRMTERVFYIKDEAKNNNSINKSITDNKITKFWNNNAFNDFTINKNKDTNENKDNKNGQNIEECDQTNNYKNQINNIVKMRKYLDIEDFFDDSKKDFDLLDFNFTVFLKNSNK